MSKESQLGQREECNCFSCQMVQALKNAEVTPSTDETKVNVEVPKRVEKPYNHDSDNFSEAVGIDQGFVEERVNLLGRNWKEKGLKNSELVESLENVLSKRELALMAANGMVEHQLKMENSLGGKKEELKNLLEEMIKRKIGRG